MSTAETKLNAQIADSAMVIVKELRKLRQLPSTLGIKNHPQLDSQIMNALNAMVSQKINENRIIIDGAGLVTTINEKVAPQSMMDPSTTEDIGTNASVERDALKD